MTYAIRTNVPIEQSQAEIGELLRTSGADQLCTGWSNAAAFLAFSIGGRNIKLVVPMPPPCEFETTPSGRKRSAKQRQQAQEQAQRQRWRALMLIVKAKLEAIEIGASTLEREFLADLVLPTGDTVSEHLVEQGLERALNGGSNVRLLPEWTS